MLNRVNIIIMLRKTYYVNRCSQHKNSDMMGPSTDMVLVESQEKQMNPHNYDGQGVAEGTVALRTETMGQLIFSYKDTFGWYANDKSGWHGGGGTVTLAKQCQDYQVGTPAEDIELTQDERFKLECEVRWAIGYQVDADRKASKKK